MSYYTSCRDHDKNLRKKSKFCYKYSEKQREIDLKNLGDPLQMLRVIGRSFSIKPNRKQHEKEESRENFIPWNGDNANLIDKYDCRALLDFVPPDLNNEQHSKDLSDYQREINSLLNYERYRSLLLHIESGETDENLFKRIRQILAARNVKMHHITENPNSVRNADLNETLNKSARRKTERLARMYGVIGFSRMEEFNSVQEHNKKVIQTQKEKAKIARDIRLGEVRPANRRKMNKILSNTYGKSYIEVSSEEIQKRHSESSYSSDFENDCSSSKRKQKKGSVKNLISILDDLAEEAVTPHESKAEFFLKKPSKSTMKKFFPEMTPVDSVEEAMNWTNADFQRRKGLGQGDQIYESEEELNEENVRCIEGRQKRKQLKRERKRIRPEKERKKMTPSERAKLRMRMAFEKNRLEEKRRNEKRMEKIRREKELGAI